MVGRDAAVREALVIQQAQAIALSNGRGVEAMSTALEMAGDSRGAKRLADDLAKRFPEDTIV